MNRSGTLTLEFVQGSLSGSATYGGVAFPLVDFMGSVSVPYSSFIRGITFSATTINAFSTITDPATRAGVFLVKNRTDARIQISGSTPVLHAVVSNRFSGLSNTFTERISFRGNKIIALAPGEPLSLYACMLTGVAGQIFATGSASIELEIP